MTFRVAVIHMNERRVFHPLNFAAFICMMLSLHAFLLIALNLYIHACLTCACSQHCAESLHSGTVRMLEVSLPIGGTSASLSHVFIFIFIFIPIFSAH
ncbi:hypothetical protein C8R43DRAFT_1039572 [Mycena crocata]|nr:hypothetical protein C8R43DRAFT_1039572 [Mycena crocata]